MDLSQIMLAAILGSAKDTPIDIENVRGMMLGMIKNLNFKFRRSHGELVLAADGVGPYWRQKIFPHYKGNRKKRRETDTTDWVKVYEVVDQFKTELRLNFHYRFIEIPHVEADDIIGVLCTEHAKHEDIMIISMDKDFIQLHNKRVRQYDPIRDRFIKHDNPKQYLLEHIIRGDSGDGIPNMLSDDDVFMVGKRQVSMTEARFADLKKKVMSDDASTKERFRRNARLIALSKIPEEHCASILSAYESEAGKSKGLMRHYFAEHGLIRYSQSIGEF